MIYNELVNVLESVVMGLVQGLTEFIPVSSSGHLVLTETLFGRGADHLLIQALNFGTLAALVVFFWPKLVDLARQVFVKRNYRLLRNIILTAFPVAVLGLAFSRTIESNSFFASPLTVSVMLAVVGVVMIVAEKLPRLSDKKDGAGLTPKRAIGIGLAQTLALMPGVSRSGSTIIASRLSGLKPAAAAEYSFLVSIPVMIGLVLKLIVTDHDYIASNWQPLLVGNVVAFGAGIIAVKFMISYLSRRSLAAFGWYRVIIAAAFVAFLILK